MTVLDETKRTPLAVSKPQNQRISTVIIREARRRTTQLIADQQLRMIASTASQVGFVTEFCPCPRQAGRQVSSFFACDSSYHHIPRRPPPSCSLGVCHFVSVLSAFMPSPLCNILLPHKGGHIGGTDWEVFKIADFKARRRKRGGGTQRSREGRKSLKSPSEMPLHPVIV